MKELINIQAQLKAPKTQFNSHGKYKYRKCEDIHEAVKPLLKENNCTLTVTDDIIERGTRVYVRATATLTNSEGETVCTNGWAREADTPMGGMGFAQLTGATSSYARKYALNGLFSIDDTADEDTVNTHDPNWRTKEIAHMLVSVKSRDELNNIYKQYKADIDNNSDLLKIISEQGQKYPKQA